MDLRAQAPRVRRIGVLTAGSAAAQKAAIDALTKRLGELGWVQGKNIVLEFRHAENHHDRLPALARALVELPVELIITASSPAALAAKQATAAIPIVFSAVTDPVSLGLVQSLARPGGNLTGLSSLLTAIAGKQVELLKALLPRLERMALLVKPGHPANAGLLAQLSAVAGPAGIAVIVVEAATPEAIGPAIAKASLERAAAMVIPPDPMYFEQIRQIVRLASQHRIATAFSSAGFVAAGGLLSYGISYTEEFARTAVHADKILRGARPADLPVEQSDRFHTAINLRTAGELGLTIPQAVLLRADQVIE